jgi:hypothetical protein
LKRPKHEQDDYNPVIAQDRPTGYEESAKKFATQLADPPRSTALDIREMLSNIPDNLDVELAMMNGISDIVQAHLREFQRLEGENLTPVEKTELKIAIDGMRSIQKHLYQGWMGKKGWRAEHLIRGLESLAVSEGILKREKEPLTERVKKALHVG